MSSSSQKGATAYQSRRGVDEDLPIARQGAEKRGDTVEAAYQRGVTSEKHTVPNAEITEIAEAIDSGPTRERGERQSTLRFGSRRRWNSACTALMKWNQPNGGKLFSVTCGRRARRATADA